MDQAMAKRSNNPYRTRLNENIFEGYFSHYLNAETKDVLETPYGSLAGALKVMGK
jgi:hypothetical protein